MATVDLTTFETYAAIVRDELFTRQTALKGSGLPPNAIAPSASPKYTQYIDIDTDVRWEKRGTAGTSADWIEVGTGSGGGLPAVPYQVIDAPYIVTSAIENLLIDTTSGSLAVTLPTPPVNPLDIYQVVFVPLKPTYQSNPLTIETQGVPINSGAGPLVIDQTGVSVMMTYVDAVVGWAVVQHGDVGVIQTISDFGVGSYFVLKDNGYSPSHTHSVLLEESDITALLEGTITEINVTSSLNEGHTHNVKVEYKFGSFYVTDIAGNHVPPHTSEFVSIQQVYDWIAVNANHDAIPNQNILANTVGGSFNITLPESPRLNDKITIAPSNPSWDNFPVTVLRNPISLEPINQINDDVALNEVNLTVEFFYLGGTIGWAAVNKGNTTVINQVSADGVHGIVTETGHHQMEGSYDFTLGTTVGLLDPTSDIDVTGNWNFNTINGNKFIIADDVSDPQSSRYSIELLDHHPILSPSSVESKMTIRNSLNSPATSATTMHRLVDGGSCQSEFSNAGGEISIQFNSISNTGTVHFAPNHPGAIGVTSTSYILTGEQNLTIGTQFVDYITVEDSTSSIRINQTTTPHDDNVATEKFVNTAITNHIPPDGNPYTILSQDGGVYTPHNGEHVLVESVGSSAISIGSITPIDGFKFTFLVTHLTATGNIGEVDFLQGAYQLIVNGISQLSVTIQMGVVYEAVFSTSVVGTWNLTAVDDNRKGLLRDSLYTRSDARDYQGRWGSDTTSGFLAYDSSDSSIGVFAGIDSLNSTDSGILRVGARHAANADDVVDDISGREIFSEYKYDETATVPDTKLYTVTDGNTNFLTVDGIAGTTEVNANPTTDLGIATRKYVSDQLEWIRKYGPSANFDLDMNQRVFLEPTLSNGTITGPVAIGITALNPGSGVEVKCDLALYHRPEISTPDGTDWYVNETSTGLSTYKIKAGEHIVFYRDVTNPSQYHILKLLEDPALWRPLPWETLTATKQLEVRGRYMLDYTTLFDLTLPSFPSAGDEVEFLHIDGVVSTQSPPPVILPGGTDRIEQISQPMEFDVDWASIIFIYTGIQSVGWRVKINGTIRYD